MKNQDTEQTIRNIGKILKQRRLELELSQEQVSHLSGMSQAMISKIELGLGNPSLKYLITYCNSINIDLEKALKHYN